MESGRLENIEKWSGVKMDLLWVVPKETAAVLWLANFETSLRLPPVAPLLSTIDLLFFKAIGIL